jgi:formylmethanofuran:tetrahydromethanopterin formyltransferase
MVENVADITGVVTVFIGGVINVDSKENKKSKKNG